tara:strand:+ start:989 stop:1633 length:645 start_codon:yes stop_codon:yes gene_type:complete
MSRYNNRFQRIVKRLLPTRIKEVYQNKIDEANVAKWILQGKPTPPPHIVKVKTVEKFQRDTNYSVLVETGTFMGDMILSQLPNFSRIISIELSEEFWKNAKILFQNEPKVELLQGDSGEIMNQVVNQLNEPAIFWLDGHYSGGDTAKGDKISPIYEELKAIFSSSVNHCLLIDDARLFNGTDDYPKIEELKEFILTNRPNAKIDVDADTISVRY